MFLDSKGEMWFGDYGGEFGLFKYEEDKKQFKQYVSKPNNSASLTSNQILFITEDDQGKIWVGTDDGLNLYDREKDIFNGNEGALKIPSALSYAQAGNGRIWVNTYSGGGLALVGPGINDVEMLRRSMINLGVMLVLSIVTSFLFFSIPEGATIATVSPAFKYSG